MGLFHDAISIRARALYLGERLDVRALEQTDRLATAPAAIRVGDHGVAVLFRYGAVVLFHVAPLEEVGFLEQLKRFIGESFSKPELEEVEIRISADKPEGLEASILYVPDFAIERLQLVAEILARSVGLAYCEAVVRESVGAIESWARGLEATGTGGKLEDEVRKHLGKTLVVQHRMSGRIEATDKPDLLWDRPDLERIYARLEDEYELKERDKILERKLALITSTAETMLTLVHNRHANRLEWYIIILILVEIVLTVFSMAAGGR